MPDVYEPAGVRSNAVSAHAKAVGRIAPLADRGAAPISAEAALPFEG